MSDETEGVEESPWASGEPVQLEVTDVLDLHTFAPRDVLPVVEAYLEEARAKGFETVRIIHGKGKGVQRARVQAALSRTPFVESFQDGPMGAGGWGATIVWFRPRERSL
jgi:dsDNA-specific endonuclease/ATPase MutS2